MEICATIFAIPENLSISKKEFKQAFLNHFSEDEYSQELYKEALEWFDHCVNLEMPSFVYPGDLKNSQLWEPILNIMEKKCYKISVLGIANRYGNAIAIVSVKIIKDAFLATCSSEDILKLINRK